jgi:KTSC domain
MNYQPVKSSNVEAVGYDEATQTLGVKFKGGSEHHYDNVTPEQHKALVSAKSIGKHFHANIRGKFSSRQVN